MIFYIPWTDTVLLLLYDSTYQRSHLLGLDSHDVGSFSPGQAAACGWIYIGEL